MSAIVPQGTPGSIKVAAITNAPQGDIRTISSRASSESGGESLAPAEQTNACEREDQLET